MAVTATDTRLLLRKIAKYCILWFENYLKDFKRKQKFKEQETDLQRCQGRDKLERNQDKTVRRKGGNKWGRQMYWAGNQVKGEGERGSKQDGQERDREGREEKRENKIVIKEPVEEREKQSSFLRDKRK